MKARLALLAAASLGVLLGCRTGAACNGDEECPAPYACVAGRCADAPASTGSSSTGSSSGGGTSATAHSAASTGKPAPSSRALSASASASSASASSSRGPRTCKEVLQAQPVLRGADGLRVLEFATDAGTTGVLAWCDMTTDDGGWTLVARSVPTISTGTWGWGHMTGAPGDDNSPYSLDTTRHPVPFQEVLVGSYVAGKAWEHAYRMSVPADLLAANVDGGARIGDPAVVAGTCDPMVGPSSGLPWMLRYAGFSGAGGFFFFRDNDEPGWFGLHSDIWYLAGEGTIDNCHRSGMLDQAPGMIMVR